MSNVMAILQDVDKCMRCNGCVISCKRTWKMHADNPGVHTVSPDQRVCVKTQKKVDMGPFLRYSCWHCPDPPCAPACPFKAIAKQADGAVSVDQTKCQPGLCTSIPGRYPCVINCQRGGYPKVGLGSDTIFTLAGTQLPNSDLKMNKCTLCFPRAGADDPTIPDQLPTHATQAQIDAVGERAHEPSCVYTCPAKAMKWDTQANILAYLKDSANGFILANGTRNWVGNGSMFWASKKVLLAPPKADPFVEDHLIPSAGSIPALGVVPVLAVGGLLAYSARRAKMEEATQGGEE